jgi:very-short-patch-repair endonuclease
MRTVLDCALTLPFDEALVVADSALRQEDLTATSLSEAAARLRGAGRVRATRIAAAASPLAANPFESVLRAIALEVPGLSVVPQVSIAAPGFFARPDLVDVERRLVLEADSHAWHSSRSALRRDCRRYNGLVLLGWTVLRFTWEDVMAYPDLVTDDLVRAVEHAELPRTHR